MSYPFIPFIPFDSFYTDWAFGDFNQKDGKNSIEFSLLWHPISISQAAHASNPR